jgi:hypothetical protein
MKTRALVICFLLFLTGGAFAVTSDITIEGQLDINTNILFKQTTANYTLLWNNPAGARTLYISDPGANDTFAMTAETQTLTNKTLTTPVINGMISGTTVIPVANGGTGQSAALVAGAVLYGTSTTTAGVTAAGTQYQYLQSAGAGTPIWAQPGPASKQLLTSTTAATYTTPTGVKAIIVEIIGGGGAGGGVPATASGTSGTAGGGGGGGGYTRYLITSPAATYSYQAGAHGAGAAGAVGGNGSTSTFNSVTALGGTGGAVGPAATNAVGNFAAGGAGGAAGSGGDFMALGGPGGAGIWSRYVEWGGQGGNSTFGGGAVSRGSGGTVPTTQSVAGFNGTAYGGGGSGAINYGTNSTAAGGNGADGVIIVYEYK